MSVHDLECDAPDRPPDWRWEKARIIREDPRYARYTEPDEWLFKARRFQEALVTCRDDFATYGIRRRWPDLWRAYTLKFATEDKIQRRRWEMEARLLAGEDFETVGHRVKCTEAEVIWYEKIFFHVTDRLENRGYIAHSVLGEALQAGLTERDYETLWKIYGFCGGPLVLNAMIDRFYHVTRPDGTEQIGDFLGDDIKRTSKIKTAIALRTMAVNSYNQFPLAEIYQRFQEIDKLADGGGGSGDMLTANISVMMSQLPWAVGDKKVMFSASDPTVIVGKLRSELVDLDSGGIELRTDQLLDVSVGKVPYGLRELAHKKFPEKPDADVKQGS